MRHQAAGSEGPLAGTEGAQVGEGRAATGNRRLGGIGSLPDIWRI
ncbi:hypothetical protein ACGFWI_30275 [Streptomyces sp. NPDC048434]